MVIVRNRSIDAIKGILIFLVVIGHVIIGQVDENLIRYVIYTFHMPTFFFVSGYLLNTEKLRVQKYPHILSTYWKRMLMEWSFAWIVYMFYVLYKDGINITTIIYNLYAPWYHLWFVPSLFIMISCLWIFYVTVKEPNKRFVTLFILGLFFYYLTYTDFRISQMLNCCHLLFFVLGVFAKKHLSNIRNGGGIIILLYVLCIISINLFINNTMDYFRIYMGMPFVITLCVFGILPILQHAQFHGNILEYWGRNSLHIYLWHVIPVIGLKWLFAGNKLLYYTASSIIILISIVLTHVACRHFASVENK